MYKSDNLKPKRLTDKQMKTCAQCGRSFSNRKKWSSRGVWHQVRYCSKKCKSMAKRVHINAVRLGSGAHPQ